MIITFQQGKKKLWIKDEKTPPEPLFAPRPEFIAKSI